MIALKSKIDVNGAKHDKTCMLRTTKCQWKVKALKHWWARLNDSEMLRFLSNLIFSFDIIPIKIQAGIFSLESFQILLERERVRNRHSNQKCKTLLDPPDIPSRQPLQPMVSPGMEQCPYIDWQTGLTMGQRQFNEEFGGPMGKTCYCRGGHTNTVNTTLTRVDLTV